MWPGYELMRQAVATFKSLCVPRLKVAFWLHLIRTLASWYSCQGYLPHVESCFSGLQRHRRHTLHGLLWQPWRAAPTGQATLLLSRMIVSV